jgi:hypothetical protein
VKKKGGSGCVAEGENERQGRSINDKYGPLQVIVMTIHEFEKKKKKEKKKVIQDRREIFVCYGGEGLFIPVAGRKFT